MLSTRVVRGVVEVPADAATFQRSLIQRILLQVLLVGLLLAPLGGVFMAGVVAALFFNGIAMLEYAGRWSDR